MKRILELLVLEPWWRFQSWLWMRRKMREYHALRARGERLPVAPYVVHERRHG